MDDILPTANYLLINKTARYYTIGDDSKKVDTLWIVLHGYGQLSAYFIRHFRILESPGTLIIAPEALSRFYESGTSGRVAASWMTRDDREKDIVDNVAYLDTLYQHLQQTHGNNIKKLIVFGFSQGGAAAARWVALGNIKPQHLIIWGSDIPPYLYEPGFIKNMEHAKLWYVYGDNDQYITPEKTQTNLNKLNSLPVLSEVLIYKGTHEILRDTLLELASKTK